VQTEPNVPNWTVDSNSPVTKSSAGNVTLDPSSNYDYHYFIGKVKNTYSDGDVKVTKVNGNSDPRFTYYQSDGTAVSESADLFIGKCTENRPFVFEIKITHFTTDFDYYLNFPLATGTCHGTSGDLAKTPNGPVEAWVDGPLNSLELYCDNASVDWNVKMYGFNF